MGGQHRSLGEEGVVDDVIHCGGPFPVQWARCPSNTRRCGSGGVYLASIITQEAETGNLRVVERQDCKVEQTVRVACGR